MADLLSLNDYVQQGFQQGRERKDKSRLAQLYSSALAAPEDQRAGFVQQMAAVSPDASIKAQSQFGDMRKQAYDDLGREAGMFVALAQSGDPAATQQAYARMAQKAQAAGHPVPAQYDPKMLPMISQMAQTLGGGQQTAEQQNFAGMTQGFTPEQIREAQMIRAGLKPRAGLPSIFDTGSGVVGIDRAGYSASPIQMGGQSQPQQAPQGYAPAPDITMQILPGANVPPGDEVAMLAAAQNEGQAYAPQANGGALPQGAPMGGQIPPALDYQNGGQLRSVPKPQAPSALQEKIATARSMGVPEDQIKQMVVGGSQDADVSNLGDAAIDNAATRYNVTGTLPPLGMGKAAAGLRSRILTRAAELAGGRTAESLATQPADYKNSQSTLKALQLSSAAMSRATGALHSNATLLLAASKKALGGSWTGTRAENEVRLAMGRQTNDPDVAAYDQYVQTVANEYAKIMGGAPGSNAAATEGARADAERAIHKASSPAALQATVNSLYKEAENFKKANDAEIAKVRSTLIRGQQAPQGGGRPNVIRYDAQGNRIQ